jgi:sodium-dependent phosphate cotransporter
MSSKNLDSAGKADSEGARPGSSSRTLSSHTLTVVRLSLLVALLFGFFVGLDMMGLAFKLFGKGFAAALIEKTSNPFVGLFIGILATTLVQSSSTTTSMTVGLVAAGALTIEGAIPIIMGANIGTSVTNTLVSLAHVTRRVQFQRDFDGPMFLYFFNWIAV